MSDPAPPQDAVSVIDQEFIVGEPCPVAVDVPRAFVHLRPGSDPERARVTVAVSGCPPDEAEATLDRMGISTQQVKGTIRVSPGEGAAPADWWRWVRTLDMSLHVEMVLPSRVEANLRVPGGEALVSDLTGEVDLTVMGGTCRAEALGGSLNVRGESSEVTVTDFSGEELTARVAVGSLSLNNVEADAITLRSVAAPLHVSEVRGPASVTANSTKVHVEAVEGPWTVHSQGGPVVFDSPPTAETELAVVGSTLDVHLPDDHASRLSMTGPTLHLDEGFSFEGERTEHTIEGTLNGGGPRLDARAVGGSGVCRVQVRE
jgi:hypothetical protein